MKKPFILLFFALCGLSAFGADVTELVCAYDFENVNEVAVDGVKMQVLTNRVYCQNYANGGAWTSNINTTTPISGAKSFQINLSTPSRDNWGLQFRIDSTKLDKGALYKVSWKMACDIPNKIVFKFNGKLDTIAVVGNHTVQEIVRTNFLAANTGLTTVMFFFGNPVIGSIFQLDDIKVEKIISATPIETIIKNIQTISCSHQTLSLQTADDSDVSIFNLYGEQISSFTTKGGAATLYPLSNGTKGILLVKVVSQNGISETKKVLAD